MRLVQMEGDSGSPSQGGLSEVKRMTLRVMRSRTEGLLIQSISS
jgi:hypothetical protein